MPKINEYINLNKKPIETVHELKSEDYKIPSFEEFMKDYKADEKVNYADLGHSSIGDNEGCGPNPTQGCVVMPEVWELYLDINCFSNQSSKLNV